MNKSLFRRLLISNVLIVLIANAILFSISLENDLLSTYIIVVAIVTVIIMYFASKYILTPYNQTVEALENGINAFKDNDFSLTIHNTQYREINDIVAIYNELSAVLRTERMDIFQRELLLDTVIQSTPVALFLTNDQGHVVYSNSAARELLSLNQRLEGHKIQEIIDQLPESLKEAISKQFNGLVTDNSADTPVIFNTNCRQFNLNGRQHHLYLLKNMTTDISRKETQMWKQVIRLISHELNNSLAPIASLTSSAKKIIAQPEHIGMLSDVLETIGNRTAHLHDFISQYAQFARLPEPRKSTVKLAEFYAHIKTLVDINCIFDVHIAEAYFDAIQIEQVLINIIKNAKESGSEIEQVGFKMSQQANQLIFAVYDRGSGLEDKQMQQALLPFFTTKSTGTGVGLALCNEIVTGHGGKLLLSNREGGGLVVSFMLDLRESEEEG